MKRMDKVLKRLTELYELNRQIKKYKLKPDKKIIPKLSPR